MDYEMVSLSLVFPVGARDGDRRCINVAVLNDTALEGSETFTVSLMATDANQPLGNDLTIVTITPDNDG